MTGFTLVELMVVLTVVSILVAWAVPSFKSFIANQKIKNNSYDIMTTLIGARSEAMKRNSNVVVAPADGSNWQSGWTATAGTLTLTQHAALAGMTVSCKSGSTLVTTCPSLTYNGYGRLVATALPTIQINGSGGTYVRCITIDLSGRPRSSKASCP